jgi:hypothetical protein
LVPSKKKVAKTQNEEIASYTKVCRLLQGCFNSHLEISNIPIETAVSVNMTRQFEIYFIRPYYFHHNIRRILPILIKEDPMKLQPSTCIIFEESVNQSWNVTFQFNLL